MNQLQDNIDIIEGLASEFTAIYRVNLDDGTYRNYVATDRIVDVSNMFSSLPKALDLYDYFVEHYVHPDHRESMRAFYQSNDRVRESLRGVKKLRTYFKRKYAEGYMWTEMEIIKCEEPDEEAHSVVMGFIECDKEYKLDLDAAAKDQILSDITQALYSYNLTVNLEDGSFKLITGTGGENAIESMKGARNYRDVYRKMMARVRSEYQDRIRELMSFDYLWMNRKKLGYYRTEEYQTIGDDETSLWEEVNVTFGVDGDGHPVANLLGRDITKARREKALQEQKIKAAQAKNEVLSDLTQTLYGFNVTVNLVADTYTLITGTGTETICALLEDGLDSPYSKVADELIAHVPVDYKTEAFKAIGRDVLLGQRHRRGFIGTRRFPWIAADGTEYWCETNAFIGEGGGGEAVVNLLGRDITEQHNEQARREREARASAAKDQILSGITQSLYGYNVTVDLETRKSSVIRGTGLDSIVDVMESLTDYQSLTKVCLKRIPKEQHGKAMKLLAIDAMRKFAKAGVRGFAGSVEYESDCPQCGRQWHEVNLFISTDEKGVQVANILARDITEQHERQERREREREAAAAKDRVLSEITQALYGYNLTVNLRTLKYTVITGTGMDAACEVFKSTDDYGRAVMLKREFIVPEDRERISKLMEPESLKKMVSDGASGAIGAVAYEANVNGEHQWHETNVFIGTDENGDPIANILGRNITEQRTRADAEAKLLVAQQANKAKTAFLFNMSHDIRTPMNAIIGFTDIAKKSIGDNGRVRDCLDKIESSSGLLLSLINSVLDMSRVESGKAKLDESVGDVTESFADIEPTMRELAKGRGVGLSFEYGDIADRRIYADHDRINRVFVNIISNSIKYSKPNGWVRAKCEQVEGKKDGCAWYKYTFEDNGIGMSEDFLGHIFEEFARERNSTTSGIQGTGLGMPLCKTFVELMGGTITCRSKQGEGTTITVTLPFKVVEAAETEEKRPARLSASPVSSSGFAGKRVLLVEDNEMNREVAEFLLGEQKFKVEAAADGSVAVKLVKEKGLDYYDYILMDIQMPIMGGYEATRIIRDLGFERPVIALSANAFAEDRAASFAAGMDDHVAKPIKVKDLMSALAKFG